MDNSSLRDSYEELRAFALSPVKIPIQPIGVDLWFKKGFSSWILTMLPKDSPQINENPIQPENPAMPAAQVGNIDITPGLVTSLSNILMEWSDKDVRQQNQEGTFNPQSLPVHPSVNPSPSL